MNQFLFIVLISIFIFVALFITPFAFIWSINNLFDFSIDYSLKNLFFAWILLWVLKIVTYNHELPTR